MKSTKIGIVVIVAILACSCAHSPYEGEQVTEAVMDEIVFAESSGFEDQNHSPEIYISSSAAVENPNDTTRNMIRTANIKFKVKDVINATLLFYVFRIQNLTPR